MPKQASRRQAIRECSAGTSAYVSRLNVQEGSTLHNYFGELSLYLNAVALLDEFTWLHPARPAREGNTCTVASG